jgi:hypothetical protein
MADSEAGVKWWIRYVIVPLIGGGSLIALMIAFFAKKDEPYANSSKSIAPVVASPQAVTPTSRARMSSASGSTGIKIEGSSDITLDHNTIDGFDTAIDVQNSSAVKAKGNLINGGRTSLNLSATPEPSVSPPY